MSHEGGRQGGHEGGRGDIGRNDSPEVRERLSRSRGEIDPEPSGAEDEVEELRLELARTRAQMSETIYALQERANPDYVRHQAAEQIRNTAQNSGVARTIRENPVPAALTGAGLVGLPWLIASARNQGAERGSEQHNLPHAGYGDPYMRESSYGSSTSYGYGNYREERSRAGQGADQARQRASERASQAGDQAQEHAQRAQAQAQEKAQRAKGGFQQALQENPLALGAAAIGLGVAVGLALPSTAKEDEIMGETRDQLVNRAQRSAQDATQRAQRVIGEAKETAEEEARRQDLAD